LGFLCDDKFLTGGRGVLNKKNPRFTAAQSSLQRKPTKEKAKKKSQVVCNIPSLLFLEIASS